MISITKTTNMNGTITIGGKQVAFMSAAIQPDGKYNINYSVQDVVIESNHREEVDNDKAEFELAVRSASEGVLK